MKQKILLSSLLTCAIFCFCSCSNEEDEFTFNSKKLASTELNVTNNQDSWKSHTNLTHPGKVF